MFLWCLELGLAHTPRKGELHSYFAGKDPGKGGGVSGAGDVWNGPSEASQYQTERQRRNSRTGGVPG